MRYLWRPLPCWLPRPCALQHLKSLAPSALVAVGGEGFWGERDAYKAMNPGAAGGSDWASKTGQVCKRVCVSEWQGEGPACGCRVGCRPPAL